MTSWVAHPGYLTKLIELYSEEHRDYTKIEALLRKEPKYAQMRGNWGKGNPPLWYSIWCQNPRDAKFADLLLKYGADPFQRDSWGHTFLHACVTYADETMIPIVRLLTIHLGKNAMKKLVATGTRDKPDRTPLRMLNAKNAVHKTIYNILEPYT